MKICIAFFLFQFQELVNGNVTTRKRRDLEATPMVKKIVSEYLNSAVSK